MDWPPRGTVRSRRETRAAKLTDAQRDEMHRRVLARDVTGESIAQIAREFGLSPSGVRSSAAAAAAVTRPQKPAEAPPPPVLRPPRPRALLVDASAAEQEARQP
jgi:hypothetical protein